VEAFVRLHGGLLECSHDMARKRTVWYKAPPLFTDPDGRQGLAAGG